MLNNKGNRAKKIFDFLHRNIIVIIIAVVVLAGAISTILIVQGDVIAPEEEDKTQYETVNTIYLAMDPVETLNPLVSQDRDVYFISQLVYSSLFQLDDTLNFTGDLVDSYNVNTSKGEVSIQLKKGVTFSDGSELTGEDVRYTVDQIRRIGEDSPYFTYISKIESVTTSGDSNLTIQFESSSDAALDNLIFPIVSSSSYDTSTGRVTGSGPYAYGKYDSGKSLNLKPNKNYYGDIATSKIQFKIISDKTKTTGLMTMDAVTAYVNQAQDADVDAEDKGLAATSIPSNEMEYLAFNFDNKTLAIKEVRQAIAMAIDTDNLIKDNYGNSGLSSDTIYFPGFLGTKNEGDAYPQDQREAIALLNEAGFKDLNEDGILENENGKKLSLTILVNKGNSNRSDCASSIAKALEDIGIDVTLKSLSWSNYRSAINKGNYDLYLGGYKFDKKYDLRALFRKTNHLGYDNSQVRNLVSSLETALTAEDAKETYNQLKTILTDEIPYYCLCYKAYTFVTVNRFIGEEIPTFFNEYRGCQNWTWERIITTEEEETTES